MNKTIYASLAEPARKLVDQIEVASGIEIQVKSKSNREVGGKISEAFGQNVVGVFIGPGAITIESPGDIGLISIDDYIHELLHLERTFVSLVPHLYPKKKSDGSDAANLENWLEHTFIYKKHMQISSSYGEQKDKELADFWKKCLGALRV